MGKISDMQENQNDINLSYVRNKSKQRKVSKPRLKIKNIKDLATLIGPTAGKYRLSPNQRNFQLKGRLTIAAIAAALSISSGISISNSIKNNFEETQEILQEDELMNAVENQLLDYVFGSDRDDVDNPSISYSFDKSDGSSTLFITSGTGNSKEIVYTYSNGGVSIDKFKNAKEVSSLMDNAISVHFSKNASQKQLQDLNESLEDLENKNFRLKNNRIIEDKQLESEEER